MTALTEAEQNLLTAVRAVAFDEQNCAALQGMYDEAEEALIAAHLQYANSVVALTEARRALR